MNDFTKDELQDLKFCVTDHTRYQGDSIHDILASKLQAMIDNYCDHDLKSVSDVDYVVVCRKCDKTGGYS